MITQSKLPSAGLGNKMFSWASGLVFSKINHCTWIITGMTKIHIGPILRRENSMRFYKGYFDNEKIFLPFKYWFLKKIILTQKDASSVFNERACFVFNEIPHWSDSFITIRNFRQLIINEFWLTLTSSIKKRILNHEEPLLSVHIRMGDFRYLQDNEDFSQVGAVRTPLEYFIEIIQKIRHFVGGCTPVTIFSDGKDNELEPILSLPNIKRAEKDLDIVHLALMSKSHIIIMSAGSTFSHWAGFLSNAVLINHYQHLHTPIRPLEINEYKYEGGLKPTENIEDIPLLRDNLSLLINHKSHLS